MALETKFQKFAQQLPDASVLTGTVDQIRQWLKSRGWRRHDRACGPNQSDELWHAPFELKWTTCGVSLPSAVKAQLKVDGFDVRNLRV